MKDLIKRIVQSLVDNPEQVAVTVYFEDYKNEKIQE